MDLIIIGLVLVFAGYGAGTLKQSVQEYFTGIRDGVDLMNENTELSNEMHNRMVDALETMVQQQQNRNSDNVVDMQAHRRTGTDSEPVVEFHDETPTEYKREG